MNAAARILQYLVEKQAEESESSIELNLETDLLESGMLDSLDFLNLLSFIEEEFNLEIPVEHLTPENFCTAKMAGELIEEIVASDS